MFGEGESFKDFYLKQSNGRFLAKGDVSDWVTVPYNEARYGHNPDKGDGTRGRRLLELHQGHRHRLVQRAEGRGQDRRRSRPTSRSSTRSTATTSTATASSTSADGYIDHFQAIHAGEGEAGGGAQGEDAIWSHRWYAYSTDAGTTGPSFNKLGGVQLGDSGMWIGDYTTEPENGGLGVFAHEFGHDLGLPDLYDTAGGDNSTAFWTLMSGGSWLNHGTDSIGTTPGYMGAWEKLQLGWLDYKVVPYGTDMTVKLAANLATRTNARPSSCRCPSAR